MTVLDPDRKYVFCGAYGGFNDQMCQIGKCIDYAKFHDRDLIINTSDTGIARPFSRVFEPLGNLHVNCLCSSDVSAEELERYDVYPGNFRGRLSSVYEDFRRQPGGIMGKFKFSDNQLIWASVERDKSGEQISLRKRSDPVEKIVAHLTGGGGLKSLRIFQHFALTKEWADAVVQSMAHLPASYSAVQLRATDMRVENIEAFLKSISAELRGRSILICSDSASAIEQAKTILGADNDIYSVSSIPKGFTGRLHGSPEIRATDQYLVALLSDLCALSDA